MKHETLTARIQELMRAGKTRDEIVEALGGPDACSRQMLNYAHRTLNKPRKPRGPRPTCPP